MTAVKECAAIFFARLDVDDACAALAAVPDLRTRIPFPVSGPHLVGIFYVTLDQARQARARESKGLGPFPCLLTTNPALPAAIDLQAPNFLFGRNRAKGLVLRVRPAASATIWQHVQIFKFRSKEISYPVDLGFVLGLSAGEQLGSVKPRLLSLLQYTVGVWRGLL